MQVLMLSQLSNTHDSRKAASHLHSLRETLCFFQLSIRVQCLCRLFLWQVS